jgi:hypothetical protein
MARTWCRRHYHRWWRRGDPEAPRLPTSTPRHDLTGRRFGVLKVVDYAAGAWRCVCDCGNETAVPTKDLTAGNTASCGCRRTARKDGPVGYVAAHERLIQDLGPATDRECSDCGRPAAHWSYDHADPDEITDWRGFPYSLDPAYYAPRCYSCHRRLDHAAARRRRAG